MKDLRESLFPFSLKDPLEKLGTVGMVFAGGGYKGAAATGCLRALVRRRIITTRNPYTQKNLYAQGVSVCDIILAHFLQAQTDDDFGPLLDIQDARWDHIEKLGPDAIFNFSWKKIKLSHIWDPDPDKPHYILENDRLFWLLDNVSPELLVNSPAHFEFPVIDNETKAHIMLSNKDEVYRKRPKLILPGIVCGASLRPVFPPVEYLPGRFGYDGGYISIKGAIEHGCDTVFVLFPYQKEYKRPIPGQSFLAKHSRILDEFASCYSALLREKDADALREAETHNELLAARAKGLRGLLNRVKSRVSSVAGDIIDHLDPLEKEEADEIKLKPIRVVPIYAEPPETLGLSSFNRGDLTFIRKHTEEQTERVIDDLFDSLK